MTTETEVKIGGRAVAVGTTKRIGGYAVTVTSDRIVIDGSGAWIREWTEGTTLQAAANRAVKLLRSHARQSVRRAEHAVKYERDDLARLLKRQAATVAQYERGVTSAEKVVPKVEKRTARILEAFR